ncbi:hypothetical protein [Virgibacillus siamensis]|uniref:hypothetical protein n=1 Tax=Virgibacillus siamensis TaxID=480071 RepID=UPI0009877696|nr:hypothetical protein [Virgibacillus siamensis]
MNYWFLLNVGLFVFAVVRMIRDFSFPVLVAVCGLLCILFNWNMHAIFSKVRYLTSRNERIKIAKRARKIMPFHVLIGLTGFSLIVLHLSLILGNYGLADVTPKIISGGIAFIGVTGVMASGWLRRIKATGKRRLAHLYLSMLLYFLILLHIFL